MFWLIIHYTSRDFLAKAILHIIFRFSKYTLVLHKQCQNTSLFKLRDEKVHPLRLKINAWGALQLR